MSEFFYNLMHPLPNAVTTVIVGVLLVYWIFVFLSGSGFDDPDLGFDFDVDVPDAPDANSGEMDDIDSDSDPSPEKQEGFFIKFMKFINVGRVPFMLILSTFKFFLWIGSLITTQLINVTSWGLYSLLILIPLAFAGIFLTKFATNPMAKFFHEIGYKGEEEIDFLGRSGKMLSNIRDQKIGVAEFMVDKNPIRLNVVSRDGSELKFGDYVIVSDESDDRKRYFVEKEMSIRNF